ncbi:MAG: hypothetical protein ACKKMV_00305 [Candidatus Nealsonbacteria bacterium]
MSGDTLNFRDISKSTAKKEISSFILKEKERGVKRISTLDIVLKTKIPAKQVESVLEEFKEENKIKEINA